jgi:ABC-type multidrug transport system permease subunit
VSYLISHFLFELPFVFLISLVCSSAVYWLVGLYPDPNRFFIFVANLYISLLVAESYMVLISAVIPYFIVGIAVGAFINGGAIVIFLFDSFSHIRSVHVRDGLLYRL